MYKKIIVCTFLLFITQIALCKLDTLSTTFFPHVGFPIGVGAPDFFKQYAEAPGGKNNVLKPSPVVGFGTKYQISNVSRVGILFSYYQTNFSEGFHDIIYPNADESPERYITEDIKTTDMILFATYDYCPYLLSQFDTYIGGGIGVNISDVYWLEGVNTPLKNDLRKGGIRIDDTYFSLISRFCLGLELGWDKKRRDALLHDFILEAAYVYDFRSIAMFSRFANQYAEPGDFIDEEFRIIPNYFTFSVAVSLNLVRKF